MDPDSMSLDSPPSNEHVPRPVATKNRCHYETDRTKPELDLPFGTNFSIKVQYGAQWDERAPYSEVNYAKVQDFQDLVKQMRKITNLETKNDKLLFRASYCMINLTVIRCVQDQTGWDSVVIAAQNAFYSWRAAAPAQAVPPSVPEVVHSSQESATQISEQLVQFHGLRMLVRKVDVGDEGFRYHALEEDES